MLNFFLLFTKISLILNYLIVMMLSRVILLIPTASKIHLSKGYVKLPSNNYIWTVVANHREHKTPLVLIHGMGGGTGLWVSF